MSAGVSSSAPMTLPAKTGRKSSSVSKAVSRKRCLRSANLPKRIRRILHDGRQHMLAGRRQARIVDGRDGDLHDGAAENSPYLA